MKTVLFLDANDTIKEAIIYAKRCGCRVITCDNVPTHFCHTLADKAYNISTYDIESLKDIVEKEHIDGIVYFASAHGLYAASRLNEIYCLSGIPYSIENIFSNKSLFRHFLFNNGFDCPSFQTISSVNEIDLQSLVYPLIVKPVDSSGGNVGVNKVLSFNELFPAVELALDKSFSKLALIESFIESSLQINGDCLVVNGQLKLAYLGKYVYSDKESIIPYATIFSSDILDNVLYERIKHEIQKVITLTDLKSGILNVELRIGENGNIYFIEINPRHSGNQIYRLMNIAYGIDMSEIAVKLVLGDSILIKSGPPVGNYAYCILYSDKAGVLDSIGLSQELSTNLLIYNQFSHNGDDVNKFLLLKDRLALLHLSFDSSEYMCDIVECLKKYYTINLKTC